MVDALNSCTRMFRHSNSRTCFSCTAVWRGPAFIWLCSSCAMCSATCDPGEGQGLWSEEHCYTSSALNGFGAGSRGPISPLHTVCEFGSRKTSSAQKAGQQVTQLCACQSAHTAKVLWYRGYGTGPRACTSSSRSRAALSFVTQHTSAAWSAELRLATDNEASGWLCLPGWSPGCNGSNPSAYEMNAHLMLLRIRFGVFFF